MKSIGYDNIEDILLNIADPNTGGAISEVPGVSAPKINAGVSVYNVEGGGIAGWSTNVTWSSSAYNSISWSSGYIYLPSGEAISVTSGSASLSATTYIYYDKTNQGVYYTTSAEASVGDDKILLCVAAPTESGKQCAFQAFGTNAQSTFITADNIAANAIATNSLISNTITGRTVQTASSGERFVMSSSQVAQYDSNGTKRVEYTGNGITFYDGSGIQTGQLVGQDGAIHTTNFDASYIDAYSVSTDELDVSDAATFKYVTISSSGDLDCNSDADFSGRTVISGRLKIPVGVDLY